MNDKKIQAIKTRIDKLKEQQIDFSKRRKNPSFAFIDVASELVAGVIVGVIVGLLLDNLFNTKPLFLVICIIFAMISSFRSIWKKHIQNSINKNEA